MDAMFLRYAALSPLTSVADTSCRKQAKLASPPTNGPLISQTLSVERLSGRGLHV